MKPAPIILFAFKRPEHTLKVLQALSQNTLAAESELYIYCDGPKINASPEDVNGIERTRKIVRSRKWCGKVNIIEHKANMGLEKAIITGVTEVINKHGDAIVLEDDIVPSLYFLQFMNDALDVYRNEKKVMSIGALNFFATDDGVEDTFFAPIPDCWGWATWADRWVHFEGNAQKLLNRLNDKGLTDRFNLNGAYNFEQMLIEQIKGTISSWAIRWQALAYIDDKLTLYPKHSVTMNIGFDELGTHGGDDHYTDKIRFATTKINVQKIPVELKHENEKRMIDGYARIGGTSKKFHPKAAVRRALKALTPPAITDIYRKLRSTGNIGIWRGDFRTWQDAKASSSGYDDPAILRITKDAALKVKNGEAAGERDSVLFEKVQYSWPVTSHLLKIIIENDNNLNLIDFGGALGSSYFQNKRLIPKNVCVSWNVVEQEKYIEVGNRDIADGNLSFHYTLREAYDKSAAKTLLLSSVLQYLEKPYDFLDDVMRYSFENIIVDRTAFIEGDTDRITVQKVPDKIYKASYPAWFFSLRKFKAWFQADYEIVYDFNDTFTERVRLDENTTGTWKGFILRRRDL